MGVVVAAAVYSSSSNVNLNESTISQIFQAVPFSRGRDTGVKAALTLGTFLFRHAQTWRREI